MEPSAAAKQHPNSAGKFDLSSLPPSVRAKALAALDSIDRLEASFGWALALFGMGNQRTASPAFKQ